MKINSISPNYNNNRQSFKGIVPDAVKTPVVNGFSHIYTHLAQTKPMQGFVKHFSNSNNTFTHLLVAESCFLSSFYMLNTLKNKKIKKEQKPQMVINDMLTLGFSTMGAYLAENKITNTVNKFVEGKYFPKHEDFYAKLGKKAQETAGEIKLNNLLEKVAGAISKEGNKVVDTSEITDLMASHLDNIVTSKNTKKAFQVSADSFEAVKDKVAKAVVENKGSVDKAKEAVKDLTEKLYNKSAARDAADTVLPGINKLKVLVIFGLIYRYLGPVVITPIANKLSSKFFDKNKKPEQTVQAKK